MKTINTRYPGMWLALLALVAAPQTFAQAAKPVDMQGVWMVRGGGGGGGDAFNQRPQSQWSTEKLPFTTNGLEIFEANHPGKGPRQVPIPQRNDPIIGANPNGLYRSLIYSRPIEMMQEPGKIVQLFAWGRVFRIIYTDGRPVPDDIAQGPFWYGYSVGKWEGDTLVVTTLALDGRAWMDEWGTPISDDARIVERWKRIAPDKLQVQITVTDPEIYSKPWTSVPVTYALQKKGVEPDEIIFAPMDEAAFNQDVAGPAGGASRTK